MASSFGKMRTTSVRRLISPLRRSIGLVTGMIMTVPPVPAGNERLSAYGATIRDRGTESTPSAGRPIYWMSCELALVAGRPCDLTGCADSADRRCRVAPGSRPFEEEPMRRVIGMDIRRTFAEVVVWEDGQLRALLGRMTPRAGL